MNTYKFMYTENQCLYGKTSNEEAILRSVECLHLSDQKWVNIKDMKLARSFCSAVVLEDQLYVLGGDTSNYLRWEPYLRSSNSMECYDPKKKSWKMMKTTMNTGRSNFASAVLNKKVYVMGGMSFSEKDNKKVVESSVERFDPLVQMYNRFNEPVFERMAPMKNARCDFTASVLDGHLYVVGGQFDNKPVTSIERYNEETNTWQEIRGLEVSRHCHAAAVMFETSVTGTSARDKSVKKVQQPPKLGKKKGGGENLS